MFKEPQDQRSYGSDDEKRESDKHYPRERRMRDVGRPWGKLQIRPERFARDRGAKKRQQHDQNDRQEEQISGCLFHCVSDLFLRVFFVLLIFTVS